MCGEEKIGGRKCYLYERLGAYKHPQNILIQAIDEHDLEVLDREVELIEELAKGVDFVLAAFLICDWNGELSPWQAPAVFGAHAFGDGAAETLHFVTDALIPELEKRYSYDDVAECIKDAEAAGGRNTTFWLGGYSLSGLFSLWSAYQTERFDGVAAISPSVWFPGWDEYMEKHSMRTSRVYLSLGDREERTKNPIMAKVGENIRRQQEILQADSKVQECVLEWNPGNHFKDSEIRCAKGFAWLLNYQKRRN
ncbi:MAG: esterase [Lachnospiraceae bacterium]|nr:esterase [Lachnospiraceae bacterium]